MSSKKNRKPLKIIASEIYEGDLDLKTDVHIYGRFEGSLHTEGSLFIYENAIFIGEAFAANAHIRGYFSGNLAAKDYCIFSKDAIFKGILDTSKSVIALGTELIGTVRISQSS